MTVRSGIGVSNGLAFSPDGRTMYFADTHRDTVWAYDYDLDTGEATNERVFLDFGPLPGHPDGACVDEAGCYWIACVTGGKVLRVTPAGAIDRQIRCRSQSRRCPRSAARALDAVHHDDRWRRIPCGSTRVSPRRAAFRGRAGVSGLPEPRFAGGPGVGGCDGAALPPVWFERPSSPSSPRPCAAARSSARPPPTTRTPAWPPPWPRSPGRRVRRGGHGPCPGPGRHRPDRHRLRRDRRRGGDPSRDPGLQHARRPDHLDGRACGHADAARRQERDGSRGGAPDRHRTSYYAATRGIELAGKVLGLVGFGRIARHVARIAAGLGMRVATFDPYLPPAAVPARIERADTLDALLRGAMSCPSTSH